MKKIVALLLTLCLIFSAMPMQAFAMEYDDDAEWAERMAENYFTSENFENLMKAHEGDLGKVYLDQMNALKNANKMSFLKGMATVAALANGIFLLLKNAGLFEDPTAEVGKNILETLADIKNTVNEIDKKVDDLESSLISESTNLEYKFEKTKYDNYQAVWTHFFTEGSYKHMNEMIAAYNSQVNNDLLSYAKSWQSENESGIRALYSGDYELLAFSGKNMDGIGAPIPNQPKIADGTDALRINSAITLPGKYIKIENVRLTADNFEEYLLDSIKAGVISAANDGNLVINDDFYSEWNAMSDEEKLIKAASIANDLFDSLHYEVIHRVANSPNANGGSFASQFKSEYDAFCDAFVGSRDVISPLYAAYMKLTLTHAFEGEIFDSWLTYCAYFGTMSVEYGTYAKLITSLDDGMSTVKKQKVEDNDKKTYAYVIYCLDKLLTGYDNYCYPLKALVEYHDVLLVSEFEAKKPCTTAVEMKTTIPWSVVDSAEYSVLQTAEEKQTDIDHMSGLLSVRDVSLLYYYYQENAGNKDFMTYLENNNAVKAEKTEDKGYNTTLVTSGYTIKDWQIKDEIVKMMGYVFGYRQSKSDIEFMDNEENIVANDCGVYKYLIKDCAEGNLFDVSAGRTGASPVSDTNGRITNNTRLAVRGAGRTFFLGTFLYCDGVYTKTTNVPGYGLGSAGYDSSSEFANATYTISTGYNYGALVVVPLPEVAEESGTASIFNNGNIALICGGAVLLCAAGFGGGFLVGKKKKRED